MFVEEYEKEINRIVDAFYTFRACNERLEGTAYEIEVRVDEIDRDYWYMKVSTIVLYEKYIKYEIANLIDHGERKTLLIQRGNIPIVMFLLNKVFENAKDYLGFELPLKIEEFEPTNKYSTRFIYVLRTPNSDYVLERETYLPMPVYSTNNFVVLAKAIKAFVLSEDEWKEIESILELDNEIANILVELRRKGITQDELGPMLGNLLLAFSQGRTRIVAKRVLVQLGLETKKNAIESVKYSIEVAKKEILPFLKHVLLEEILLS